MAYEGGSSRSLSDEEQDVLREFSHATVLLPQDLVVAPGLEPDLPKSASFALMPTSETPRGRMRIGDRAEASVRRHIFDHRDGVDLRMASATLSRISDTDTAPHHPERKLS